MNPYFQLFQGLPREGPGEASDVSWAVNLAKLNPNARMCDVACGTGTDTTALCHAVPQGHVTAFDKQPDFVDVARATNRENARVNVHVGDMNDTLLGAPFDLIWCAGAVYFTGITKALNLWRPSLAKGGVVAFSQICWWKDIPGSKARKFWGTGYSDMTDEAGIKAQIDAAQYQLLGTRRVSDTEWARYYNTLQAQVQSLRPTAKSNVGLMAVLNETQTEIDVWKACGDEFGYLISVAQPT